MMAAALLLFKNVPRWLYALIAIMLLLAAVNWQGRHAVRQEWKAADKQREADEQAAIETRNESNRLLAKAQAATNARISNDHKNEITRVRAAVANAPRVRVGQAICNRPAGTTEASISTGSNGTDTRGGLVREDVDRDIRALMIRVEEITATARACQAAARENGLAPSEN